MFALDVSHVGLVCGMLGMLFSNFNKGTLQQSVRQQEIVHHVFPDQPIQVVCNVTCEASASIPVQGYSWGWFFYIFGVVSGLLLAFLGKLFVSCIYRAPAAQTQQVSDVSAPVGVGKGAAKTGIHKSALALSN